MPTGTFRKCPKCSYKVHIICQCGKILRARKAVSKSGTEGEEKHRKFSRDYAARKRALESADQADKSRKYSRACVARRRAL